MRRTWTLATSGWTVAAIYAASRPMGWFEHTPPTSFWVSAAGCFLFGLWLSFAGPER